MTQIKSENAKRILQENRSAECMPYGMCTANGHFDLEHDYVSLDYVLEAVIIAEKEAEERHVKELQELRDKAVDEYRKCCPSIGSTNNCTKGDTDCDWSCPRQWCEFILRFTQKLNE